MSTEELESVSGIGKVVADNIYIWFREKKNLHTLNAVLDHVEVLIESEPEKSHIQQIFKGKIFVLTGTLPTLSRDEAGEMIRARGGDVSSSVSTKTSFVLAGEKAGSKLAEAHKHNVQIITEEEFLKML